MSLTCLSWNLSSREVSSEAPEHLTLPDNHKAIIEVILECNPDVITLQEVTLEFEKLFLSKSSYVKVTSCLSHCESTVIYIKPSIQARSLPNDSHTPIVTIEITHEAKKVLFSGAHLAPSSSGASRREEQLKTVKLDALPHILMGDLNVRSPETKYITALGWNDATAPRDFTWNSTINHYHKDGFEFVCRFDRILYHKLNRPSYQLIGNRPVDDQYYLSDHFGLLARFVLE